MNTVDRIDVAIVGGGMVGTATALACLARGLSVTLVDPGGIRNAASYGNAGVISRGSLFPVAGPGVLKKLPRYALNRDVAIRVDYGSLLAVAPWLVAFMRRCNEASWREAAAALDPLCAAAYDEHWRIAGEIGARDLIVRRGWVKLYRSEEAFAAGALERELLGQHKVAFEVIDGAELPQFEPALKRRYARAVWHTETGSVRDPGALVQAYEAAAVQRGATLVAARARTVEEDGDGAKVLLEGGGEVRAKTVVIAAGAAAHDLTRMMGYRLPLAAERGYHRHFADASEHKLSRPIHDTGGGYVVSPMNAGLRLLSGVELARREAPANFSQITAVEADARRTVAMGDSVEPAPWHGARPSTPDGLPVIGRAPHHPHVVFAFGHGHIGLSTGPITGRVVADIVTGATSAVPITPFSPGRF
ncbi:NAD(P)/FAD-dependent oxidoreductase [Phreatobacter cathodiphilus]|uniref:FAD-binding oxidoreductase n=1 Tax=Phreatobacter cathodiphilus TaxID=1868589 RepID=A0A2S0NGU3_9HYPH|nr:FAD-binding oxidoreductase [Phreatobacter cathodiphilus]AVO47375.1 FAD-binding oxidoreductase [Phreatobacter cathodiphilus]